MADRGVGQGARVALDAGSHQDRVQRRRQQMLPRTVVARARQVVEHELHGDRHQVRYAERGTCHLSPVTGLRAPSHFTRRGMNVAWKRSVGCFLAGSDMTVELGIQRD